jgi:nickel/cobalt transporter (NicO) family protein
MRPTHWLLGLLGAAGLSMALAVPASAHPLGNFTINQFSRVQLNGSQIEVLYVVDYAEIPAFQEQQRMGDDPAYAGRQFEALARGLRLEIDGRPLQLTMKDQSLTWLPGQAGLQTLRLQLLLAATAPTSMRHSASYTNTNFSGRLGWKEIVVEATGRASLLRSSAPATSISDELRRYPQNLLTSPLDVRQAGFTFVPTAVASNEAAIRLEVPGPFRLVQDRFAALITPTDPSLQVLALTLLAAMALGALHALSPGHGKAVMAGYLVGTRGRRSTALALGITITASHTAGVFALGLVTLYAASVITPERLYPWLTLLSGILILGLGATLTWSRSRTALHGHDHEHRQALPGRISLLGMGIFGGLIPCPSALVVLLAAISLHRIIFGLLLILAFSTGLAIVLTGIGLLLASGLPLLDRASRASGRAVLASGARFLPIASAVVVMIAGIGVTAQAIPGVR